MLDAALKRRSTINATGYNNAEATLEEFARGELRDELFVGIEEVERREVWALDPTHVAKYSVLQLIFERSTAKKCRFTELPLR